MKTVYRPIFEVLILDMFFLSLCTYKCPYVYIRLLKYNILNTDLSHINRFKSVMVKDLTPTKFQFNLPSTLDLITVSLA